MYLHFVSNNSIIKYIRTIMKVTNVLPSKTSEIKKFDWKIKMNVISYLEYNLYISFMR